MSTEVSHLELRVTSDGYVTLAGNVGAAARSAEVFERQFAKVEAINRRAEDSAKRYADAAARAADTASKASQRQADSAEKAAQKRADSAVRAAAKEDDAWNNSLQKALARDEKRVESARKAAERIASVGGLDGVLPKRPSLGRIEENQGVMSGAIEGLQGSMPGMALLAGGAAGIAAVGVEKLFSTISEGKHAIVEASVEMEGLKARIAGITGSAGTANEKFEELESMTLGKLPATVREVSEAFIFLGNTGLSNSNEALKSYSNIAAQTGHSLGEVTSAVEHATMGSYKSLREYGIKVKAVGDDLKVTFRGHTETIANSSSEIEGYLQRLGNVEFTGAVERQMETMGGAVKKNHDAWEELIDTVAKSSIGDLIKQGMDAATFAVNDATAAVKFLFGTMSKAPPPIKIVEGGKGQEDTISQAMDARAQRAAELAAKNKGTSIEQETAAYAARTADDARSARKTATLARQVEEWRTGEEAKAEATNSFFNNLDGRATTSKQKAKAQLADDLASIKEALASGQEFDVSSATAAARAAYRNAIGNKEAKPGKNFDIESETFYAKYANQRMAEKQKEYDDAVASLAKKEDAEKVYYEKTKEALALNLGPDTEALTNENETLWTLHWAKLAEIKQKASDDDRKKEEDFQKRIRPFGEKPQSQTQQINAKFAGQQIDLKSDFGDRLKGDPSNPFGDDAKLAAQEQYRQKSVAIEKERIREINEANAQLVAQGAKNAEALFGNLAQAAKNSGGEQSKAYQVMFAAQKAFAIASAEVSMAVGIGKAMELGWPAGIPAAIGAAAEGAKILAMITSSNYSGAYDKGGDIPFGKVGIVGEYGPEFVRGPATVTGRQQTAQAMNGGGSSSSFGGGQQGAAASPNISVHFDINDHMDRWMSSTSGQKSLNVYMSKNSRAIQALGGGR
jgi:hypothetical protein